MTAITATIIPEAETWLRENMPDLTGDTVCAVRPIGAIRSNGSVLYEDIEEGTRKVCAFSDHVAALQLLAAQIGKTLFVGSLTSPTQLEDPCNWDVEVVDAFWQLVYHKEVIYG